MKGKNAKYSRLVMDSTPKYHPFADSKSDHRRTQTVHQDRWHFLQAALIEKVNVRWTTTMVMISIALLLTIKKPTKTTQIKNQAACTYRQQHKTYLLKESCFSDQATENNLASHFPVVELHMKYWGQQWTPSEQHTACWDMHTHCIHT